MIAQNDNDQSLKNDQLSKNPNHFGDIMSAKETFISFPPGYSPFERILLSANGNVQRILSSFFNKPIQIKVIFNKIIMENNLKTEYDRQVEILLKNDIDQEENILCVANSKIIISSETIKNLIRIQNIGIGQLFRSLNILPEFQMIDFGKDLNNFWRIYKLSSNVNGIECLIKENFSSKSFSIQSII